MNQKIISTWNTKERFSEILNRYRLKFFNNQTSSLIQLCEFDKMVSEILNQNIKCKFKNAKGYCKHKKNKSANDKYGMKCFEGGCPYYSVPYLSHVCK